MSSKFLEQRRRIHPRGCQPGRAVYTFARRRGQRRHRRQSQPHRYNRAGMTDPVPLGLKKSFGFGDRLGLATPGHLASARKFDFAPIFAQQSIREMRRTNRTPEEVMAAARSALAAEGYAGRWGADADHLKTPDD